MNLKDSDINHLRRLLGYVRCEIGQSPVEFKETLRAIAPAFAGERPNDAAYGRLLETYQKAQAVPKYVRAAVRALEKAIGMAGDETLDSQVDNCHTLIELHKQRALSAPTK